MARDRRSVWIVLLVLVLGACGRGPTAPAPPSLTLSLPPQVIGTIVTCPACTPPNWAVAEATVTLTNHGDRDRRVATVEARVLNRTRGTVIAANTRPNKDFSYPDRYVQRHGSLALEAAVVYMPLPPPGDDIQFEVVVTFDDGGRITGQSRLVTRSS